MEALAEAAEDERLDDGGIAKRMNSMVNFSFRRSL